MIKLIIFDFDETLVNVDLIPGVFIFSNNKWYLRSDVYGEIITRSLDTFVNDYEFIYKSLKELQEKGYILTIASFKANQKLIKKYVERTFPEIHFREIITPKNEFDYVSFFDFNCKYGYSKNKMLEYLMKKYDTKPQETLFIDNTKAWLICAQNIGVHTFYIPNDEGIKKETMKEIKKVYKL